MAGSIEGSESQSMDFESEAPLAAQSPSEEMALHEDIHPKETLLKLKQRMAKLLKDLEFLNAPLIPMTRSGKQQICFEYSQEDILAEGKLKRRTSEEELLLERLEALHISIEPEPSNQPNVKKGRITGENKG
jgi:hypothetical protein